ncbi:hypothetical protein DRO61_10415 [Candidatus Bathyarchaeota archaeon]|nr:MAG: hypothetical protein DRO61_10415 [Candidatus Bathyarchaeota archaeon]
MNLKKLKMSTRNLTMVVPRDISSKYVDGFAINPSEIADNSYVNMYLHHDGYPEWQGVMIAKWVKHMQDDQGFTNFGDPSRIASHLVKDFHYNSQYLYPSVKSIDHQYTYIIWTGKPDVWVSCYDQYEDKNVFVLPIHKIIEKYLDPDMEYNKFSIND